MHTEPAQPLSAQLAQPLNESIRQDNTGQFALMLSLLYEARVQPRFAPAAGGQPDADVAMPVATERAFNLEMQLNIALAEDSPAQANLLRGLIAERTEQMLAQLLPDITAEAVAGSGDQPLRRSGDALVAQLEYARQQGPGQAPGTVVAANRSPALALL